MEETFAILESAEALGKALEKKIELKSVANTSSKIIHTLSTWSGKK